MFIMCLELMARRPRYRIPVLDGLRFEGLGRRARRDEQDYRN
jgi:hypothetical protein